jgi:hypothetical protein
MLVHLGVYGFVEMVIFVLILGVGLVYAWKKGGPRSGRARGLMNRAITKIRFRLSSENTHA